VAERVAGEIDRLSSDAHATFDLQVYVDGIRLLVQRLVDDPAAALFMNDIIDARARLASHAFNVGYLSLLMGLKLDGYLVSNRGAGGRLSRRRAMNIESLGIGALLHDIGLTRLPKDTADRLQRTNGLGEFGEVEPGWRKHVEVGFEMVKGRVPATASATVLHHHQRLDGSGFPERVRGFGPPSALRGEEIHTFARIVAVADEFDRLRNPPGGRSVPTVRALNGTLELVRAGKLDPVVFKALLAVTPAYAPGTIVTLSDGRRCVVTGWDPTRPCSPTVCALPASLDEALEEHTGRPGHRGGRLASALTEGEVLGEPVDLSERRDLRVASVEGEDVTGDYFEARRDSEFDLRLQFSTPLGEGWEAIAEATYAAGGKLG
jgi:HD-GYP domain-containing protein (c-di-GMP phosphodiesterase class II)